MRKQSYLIFVALPLLTCSVAFSEISQAQGFQTASRPLTAAEILKREGPAVVMIEVRNAAGEVAGQASGVVIRRDGTIVTNLHVLEGACDVRIRFTSTQDAVPVYSVARADKDQDLVLIRALKESLPMASIGKSERLQVGDRVIAIGNPMGLERSVSEGIIAGIRTEGANTWIQVTAPISSGSSGGGLYSSSGELVGITTFSLRESQNLNFAVPIERATALLRASTEIPWATASKIFCGREPPAPDSGYILEILGRRNFDPIVVEVLRTLNGGTDPKPIIAAHARLGELRYYLFPRNGVTIIIQEGQTVDVSFGAKFGGVLPLGLSWKSNRTSVRRYLGSPARTISMPSNIPSEHNTSGCIAWEEYETESRVYKLCYDKSGELVGVSVSLPP